MTKADEYVICQERGHEGDGMMPNQTCLKKDFPRPGWLECRHCGTHYRIVTKRVLEEDAATVPAEGDFRGVESPPGEK
jgi:hypothetical protein